MILLIKKFWEINKKYLFVMDKKKENQIGTFTGTSDLFLDKSILIDKIYLIFSNLARNYGYEKLITPIIEKHLLYKKALSAGDNLFLQEEVFFFKSKSNVPLVLRPELTASVFRAIIENGFYKNLSKPIKIFYFDKVFRYERPQKNRKREFFQLGIEIIGSNNIFYDLELLFFTVSFLYKLGIKEKSYDLLINYFGSKETITRYILALKEFFVFKQKILCKDCKRRYVVNILRILDCLICVKNFSDLPVIDNFWSNSEKKFFFDFQKKLSFFKIKYIYNPFLVRGISYYTGIVFEFIEKNNRLRQASFAGGGRYDNLIKKIYNNDELVPASGLAIGFERLVSLLLKKDKEKLLKFDKNLFYIVYTKNFPLNELFFYLNKLRNYGFFFDSYFGDFVSLTKQLKKASKKGIRYVLIFLEKEFRDNFLLFKDLETGKEIKVTSELKDLVLFLSNYQWKK